MVNFILFLVGGEAEMEISAIRHTARIAMLAICAFLLVGAAAGGYRLAVVHMEKSDFCAGYAICR